MGLTIRFSEDFLSWGRIKKTSQRIVEPRWAAETHEFLNPAGNGGFTGSDSYLAHGLGRSYGDSCLNHGGYSLSTRFLNHFLSWNPSSGVIRCEAGVSLFDIIRFSVPRGWFLPVSPGTQWVSVGGAIANDVHGKNHHLAGTFGRFVKRLLLLRSDGKAYECSHQENSELFHATIAGLGLTGLILNADVQLVPISSPWVKSEELQFRSLEHFFEISAQSGREFEYTVAWLDCVSSGSSFGRGIFIRGNFASRDDEAKPRRSFHFSDRPMVSVPCVVPVILLNRSSMRAFNGVYFHKQRAALVRKYVPLTSFFYPLDGIGNWNLLYGGKGFFQFQCVLPRPHARELLPELLSRVVKSGRASFLAVLKEFGDTSSPGMLSFPRPGVTLCLDFANRGAETVALLGELEDLVREGGGAIYPAKDAVMSPAMFDAAYGARMDNFDRLRDKRCSSDFWRRVRG